MPNTTRKENELRFHLFFIAVFVILGLGSVALPALETRYFPVVTDVVIDVKPNGEGGSQVSGTFKKARECEFVALVVKKVDPPPSSSVQVIFLEGTKNRDEGVHEFGPWELNTSPENVLHNSRAVALHNCPYADIFWETETVFWSN